MRDNRNEHTQLTIDNLTQTTVFEIVDNEEKKAPLISMSYVEKNYMKKFPRKFRKYIEKWWNVPECQYYIRKALDYNLTDKDSDIVFNLGNRDQKTGKLKRENAKYPFLYHVCFIHIHPLTKCASIAKKISKLSKELNK